MKLSIPYGNEKIDFTVPDSNMCEILSPNKVTPSENLTEIIEQAIEDAISKYDNPVISVITHGGELYVY